MKTEVMSKHGVNNYGYPYVWYRLSFFFTSEEKAVGKFRQDHVHCITYYIEPKVWYSETLSRQLNVKEVRQIFKKPGALAA